MMLLRGVDLGRTVGKKEFKRLVPKLRTELLLVQNQLHESAGFSVVVVIAGSDAAGKGRTVNVLHEWMDPRFLQTHAFDRPTDEESERPLAWRYWRVLPPKGTTGIFLGSWYSEVIAAMLRGKLSEAEFQQALAHLNTFERQLTDDGTLLLKYWFHIPKQVQKKRLEKYASDPRRAWRVTEQDWRNLRHYDRLLPICDRLLSETNASHSPWLLVEGTDRRYRELTVGQHLAQAIRNRLDAPLAGPESAPVPVSLPESGVDQPTVLSTLDLTQQLTRKKYRSELEKWQARLNRLSRKAHRKRVATVLVFEGVDAAGKGGAIRRVTAALDARRYDVAPIAAPSDEERARHYLWRFWRRLPRAGDWTIFDRSWYGRVLVERVEGLATDAQWSRAYQEIRDFEELLCEHGIVLVKFWLHIDQDEQARRFAERETVPYKQYKITEEDYRNRAKWPQYEIAVHDMVQQTSGQQAPWTLVEANDKYFARIKVLRTICDRLHAATKRELANVNQSW
jgi:AMP-polyphosphate phosphotransferase